MSYKQGIVDAIQELGDRMGSSSIAIKKHMQARHPKDKKWQNATFLSSLKSGVDKGQLVKNKNSYRLHPDFKMKLKGASTTKKKKTTVVKKAEKKVAAKTKAKKPTAKKTAIKKKVSKAKTAVRTIRESSAPSFVLLMVYMRLFY
jgi:histone H1/5